MNLIFYFSIFLSYHSLTISSDLTNYLLDHGARGHFTFDDYARALPPAERRRMTAENQQKDWQKECQQPIEVAIALNHKSEIIQRLITAGADPSTITSDTLRSKNYKGELPLIGKTVLDLLQKRIKDCRKSLKELESHDDNNCGYVAPKLKTIFDRVHLLEYPKDSFQRFVAEEYLDDKNKRREAHNKGIRKKPKAIGECIASGKQSVSNLVSS